MANNTFLPTSLSLTSTFQSLATLLDAGGIDNVSENSVTSSPGYIKNNDTSISVYIGQGTSAPSSWATIAPEAAILFDAGMNVNQIWLKCASSTTTADFCEGASQYAPPLVNGVIGTITATENTVPKADADGNLVASTISDDGAGTVTIASDVVATGTLISDDATTPIIGTESGNTNTGFLQLKGKTSGTFKILPADALAQTVTVDVPAQTSGAAVVSMVDFAGVNDTFAFVTKAQTLAGKTLTAPVVNGATTAAAANNFDFSTGTGTFLTSTGANTLSGAVTVNDATTPSITLASGKTNTGFLLVNGKTSGSTKIITADATAQAVVISTAAQTVGGCTLTIPNQTGNSTNFAFANQDLRAAVTADVTNATATMSNITDLSLTLLAGATYIGTAVFKCADSTAAEGISFDFDGSAATMTAFAAGAGVLTGGTTVAVTTVSSALATDLNWTTITGETWITVQLGLTVNAAGTFIPRFCQGTAHTSGTATVYRGSWLHLTRIG